MQPIRKCVKGRLIGRSDNDGYVNLGFELENDNYLILTVCPNWNGKMPNYGELGLIEYEEVIAGVTKYFSGYEQSHKYTAAYFMAFVPIVSPVVCSDTYIM